jgi:hypothetical protein
MKMLASVRAVENSRQTVEMGVVFLLVSAGGAGAADAEAVQVVAEAVFAAAPAEFAPAETSAMPTWSAVCQA